MNQLQIAREALETCPFCGGHLHIVQDCSDSYGPCDQHDPLCPLAGIDLRIFNTESEAVWAWNHRADPTPPETPDERQAAIVAALKEQCRDPMLPEYAEFLSAYADWIESGEWRK